jgi:Fic family protein
LFEDICEVIIEIKSGIRRIPGTILHNPLTKEIMYTPPVGENIIRDKLKNLEDFIYNEKNLDPLIKMAIIHYQFESIHPFSDGNGRTGRIINLLYLINCGLLEIPVLYLSNYIIDHKSEYFNGLREVTENQQWEKWILYMLEAVESTAILTKSRILAIKDFMDETANIVKEKAPKIYSKDLIEILFSSPYCKIKFLENAKIGNRQTASIYLKKLANIGLLDPIKSGTEIYYVNHPLLNLLSLQSSKS